MSEESKMTWGEYKKIHGIDNKLSGSGLKEKVYNAWMGGSDIMIWCDILQCHIKCNDRWSLDKAIKELASLDNITTRTEYKKLFIEGL